MYNRIRWHPLLLLLLAIVCLLPTSVWAQAPSPTNQAASDQFDARVLEYIAALDPDVSEQWRAANDAREAEDFERARDLYSEILAVHPDLDHALRRRCSSHAAEQHYADALTDCKAAYALQASPENALALGLVRASATGAVRDELRAKSLARFALADSTADFAIYVGVCQIGLTLSNQPLLDDCSAKLRELDGQAWETQLFSAFAAAFGGDLDEAHEALDRAHAAGLDDASYEEVDDVFSQAESPLVYYGKRVGWGVLVWLGLAGALIAAGFGLSHLTLAEANRALTDPSASANAKDSRLRRAYAWVLWMCCAYYYLSVPLVLLSVLALGAAIVLLFVYIGRIPIKLILIVVAVVFGSIFAVLKSFFTRPNDAPPGEALDLSEAPALRRTLDEVAAKVGTRPVDHVYLDVGADIAVFERGGILAKLRGKGERCLLLGVAVLDGMDQQAFKAILAHEYGHFSNEDTAGGNFALAVRRSIMHSAVGLAEVGAAGWYNPAWAFLNGFHKVFLRVSQGASRLQEVLADRWSARCYGASSFERGLRHVIAADLQFGAHANAALREVIDGERVLANIYGYTTSKPAIAAAEVEAQVEAAVNAEPSPYDSHPRPADRFRWVQAIAQRDTEDPAEEPAWGLFSSRASIEARMTELIRDRVREQTGVRITAEPGKPKPSRRRRAAAAVDDDADGDADSGAEAREPI